MKKKTVFAILLSGIMSLVACEHSIKLVDKANLLHTNKYQYSNYMDYAPGDQDCCPSTGNPKLLIVPVWFTNSNKYILASKKDGVREDIENAYLGTPEETGWHSVSSFYKEESKGLCQLDGTVTEWYECGQRSSYYYTSTSRVTALARDAADWYFTNHTEDSRTNYDSDKDGYLDGVMLIYGCPDYTQLQITTTDTSNLWAYCYWVGRASLKNVANPGPNQFFWASYDFMYSENKALERTGTKYANGDTSHCQVDTHTFIHEMGHVFGLEDYYDYSDQYNPAGGFSMQDYNVGGHDPYSVMSLGWANPIVPSVNCQIQIETFQESHDLILLSKKYEDSPFDEYLLLELYSPTGLNEFDSVNRYSNAYPQGPNKVGIRLWHVDARMILLVNNTVYQKLVNNPMPSEGKVMHAFSNTYQEGGYGSPLGKNYINYNLLQLIRNNPSETYKPKATLTEGDLFYEGDSFSIGQYQKQFIFENDLNSQNKFTWTFTIDSIVDGVATITFKK